MKRLYIGNEYELGTGTNAAITADGRTVEPGTPAFVVPYFLQELPNLNIPVECRGQQNTTPIIEHIEPMHVYEEQHMDIETRDRWRTGLSDIERSELTLTGKNWSDSLLAAIAHARGITADYSRVTRPENSVFSNEFLYTVGHWANRMAEQGAPVDNRSLVEHIGEVVCQEFAAQSARNNSEPAAHVDGLSPASDSFGARYAA